MMHLQRSIKLSKLPCQIVLRDNICLFLPRERQWPASLLLSDYLLTFSLRQHDLLHKIHKYTNVQICKYTNMKIHKYKVLKGPNMCYIFEKLVVQVYQI